MKLETNHATVYSCYVWPRRVDTKLSASSETQVYMQYQWSYDGNTHANVTVCLQSPV